jgi:hypothetical protein
MASTVAFMPITTEANKGSLKAGTIFAYSLI